MHWKQYALAAGLAGLVMWLLAGAWHALLMAAFYRNETEASHDGVGTILIAYFILGGLMTYLYPRGTKRDRPVRDGLVFGIVIGLLWVFPHELAMAGAHGESLAYVFKNAAWHMVEQGAGGVVIGWVSGKQRDALRALPSAGSSQRATPIMW